MKNIIKDIEKNCPECHCNTEKTIQFLADHGDFSYTSEYYREVWFFYIELLKSFNGHTYKKLKARKTTLELFKISKETFKNIRKWANRCRV